MRSTVFVLLYWRMNSACFVGQRCSSIFRCEMSTMKPASPTSASSSAPQQGQKPGHTRMVRLSAYSVATVLALLMTTATLPPLLADQSDRAVINAPISLLTAPIAGEMTRVSASIGQTLRPGETVAQIHNARVDRTTLIALDSKVEELRGSLLAARQKKDSDNAYVAALDLEIRRQIEQMLAKLDGEVAEARARLAAADAEGQSTQAVVRRQQDMVERNNASIDLLRPTQHKLEAARFEKDAEAAKLTQKLAELGALKKNVFVGNQSNSLAVLTQKRRDLAFDAQRLAIEETQLAASLTSLQGLQASERMRLDSLTDARMQAANGGVVLSLGAAQGRHVSPGDSVATLVDCEQAFAVGIFSYRQAQDLAVGTTVRISAAGTTIPQRGWVSEILPKTSDRTDQQYAVPFPQTERREMYVLVSLDPTSAPAVEAAEISGPAAADVPQAARRTTPCSVGQWVTITRENGWIPSASVAWKAVASGFTGPDAKAAWGVLASSATRAAQTASDLAVRGATSPEARQVWGTVSGGVAQAADAVSHGVRRLTAKVSNPQPKGAGSAQAAPVRQHSTENTH
ncbi:HlyD family efflux transporter periplasmic adaptor subunit [Methylobacterium nonmethylotrophicum]|uniref:HlyD family efflux transporter periplasmic adaptor subunit n=1 Tax=Methylobacterium nonmethylotrophicum TaxID=1141884 RepID=A0A4Z0NFT2_9HYPH|nr:HlyD family secretion protein [Methylobacterium nonmethylotrophicum]TGD94928.1 HlyD family efflux transporter periplasmic adaptor subunit [Methylobacterium nonmethylotrophicum]